MIIFLSYDFCLKKTKTSHQNIRNLLAEISKVAQVLTDNKNIKINE